MLRQVSLRSPPSRQREEAVPGASPGCSRAAPGPHGIRGQTTPPCPRSRLTRPPEYLWRPRTAERHRVIMGTPGGRQQRARGPPACGCGRRAVESPGPGAESGPCRRDRSSRTRRPALPAPSHVLQPHACARGPAPRPGPAPHPAPPPDRLRPRTGSAPSHPSPRPSPCPAPTPTHSVPCSAPGADPARPSVRAPSEPPGGLRGRRRCGSRGSLGDAARSAIQSARRSSLEDRGGRRTRFPTPPGPAAVVSCPLAW